MHVHLRREGIVVLGHMKATSNRKRTSASSPQNGFWSGKLALISVVILDHPQSLTGLDTDYGRGIHPAMPPTSGVDSEGVL